ncbi:hypothetical protein H5410_035789 [Solanum commersonii]|uniref:Uncharacterized protein n=1 Tax=Solanum commersonii TaxID=4109 RepID=A0A9J5Y2W3_SOLCO|nr:hypothetical protein H5410_035789 [Solanum commersonii]
MVAKNRKPKSSKLFKGDYKGRRIFNVTIMDLPNVHSNPWLLELKANYDYYSFSSNKVIELRPN